MNKYAEFLKHHGKIVAAISWSKSRTLAGVVTISFNNGNPRLGYIPRSECSPQIQAMIDRCDFDQQAIACFPDGACCNFTPPMPPAQCYQWANFHRSQFVLKTTPNFRW
jgi:hypothetical protein